MHAYWCLMALFAAQLGAEPETHGFRHLPPWSDHPGFIRHDPTGLICPIVVGQMRITEGTITETGQPICRYGDDCRDAKPNCADKTVKAAVSTAASSRSARVAFKREVQRNQLADASTPTDAVMKTFKLGPHTISIALRYSPAGTQIAEAFAREFQLLNLKALSQEAVRP